MGDALRSSTGGPAPLGSVQRGSQVEQPSQGPSTMIPTKCCRGTQSLCIVINETLFPQDTAQREPFFCWSPQQVLGESGRAPRKHRGKERALLRPTFYQQEGCRESGLSFALTSTTGSWSRIRELQEALLIPPFHCA